MWLDPTHSIETCKSRQILHGILVVDRRNGRRRPALIPALYEVVGDVDLWQTCAVR